MHHTLFISDLHLEPDRPEITTCFLDFLKYRVPQADALYILGDFFEVWIGDDENTLFQQTIINAIKQLTDTGFPVYFMRGNRDFLIGETFIRKTGCRFLIDPTVITLYDTPVLLTHGDALCTDDHKHQAFRKYAYNTRLNRYFLWLPLYLRRKIARWLRELSRKHTANTAYIIMDVTPATVAQQMHTHGVTQLIHGHTHRPAIHIEENTGIKYRRIVLGDWDKQGSALVYQADGEMALITLEQSAVP